MSSTHDECDIKGGDGFSDPLPPPPDASSFRRPWREQPARLTVSGFGFPGYALHSFHSRRASARFGPANSAVFARNPVNKQNASASALRANYE